MSLRKYWEKRDFSITPEPHGSELHGEETAPGATLSYFIQRHHASRLHYDFRLELNGTLKSWAIPKGPSFDPTDKRLAVHVEDHPLSYGTFEGDIPAKQYGAGHVVLWDKGQWLPIGDPAAGYQAGNLKFMLHGHKLHGKWALVRMQKASKAEGKDNWLLIKEKDELALSGPGSQVTELRPESVAGMPEPLAAPVDTRTPNLAGPATKAAMPDHISPQLATLVQHAPSGAEWLCEVKYDGYRALARIEDGNASIYTRTGNDWSRKWPGVTKALRDIAADQAWLDGEVVALDQQGHISFQALQNMDSDAHSRKTTRLVYYVFDLLYLNGHDLRALALSERKALLKELLAHLPQGTPIFYSDHLAGKASAVFKDACKHGLEGIVVKQANAAYSSGRSTDWRKLKCVQQQEFVIGGYTQPEGSRQGFGALVLGVYDDGGQFVYCGRVGTGFDSRAIAQLSRKFKTLAIATTAFDQPPAGQDLRGVHWLKPTLVAEVRFAQWTDSGGIRHSSFIALREDKVATDIRREQAQSDAALDQAPSPVKSSKRVTGKNKADPGMAGIKLTNPDKVLFPASQQTKQDLAEYYLSIQDWIMPHLIDRPLSLLRCPDGSEQQCFFQKHHNDTTPPQVQQVKIPGNGSYMMANTIEAVVAMVQMGVLELHTWGSRQQHLLKPDRITIDLDPDPALPWVKVVEGAQLVKFLLEEIGLISFVKTTGGKGLHVVAPIKPERDFSEIKAFSKTIAEHLATTVPDYFVAVMSKSKRVNKIYLDYLRNGVDATAIAAYSTRARADGAISTPIRWEELSASMHADTFKLGNIMQRMASLKTDPWAEYSTTRQRITAAMIKTFA